MNLKNLTKGLLIIQIILIVIIASFTVALIPALETEIDVLNNEIIQSNEKIVIYKTQLEKNINQLSNWQSGNKYELYNPPFEKVEQFIQNNTVTTATETINRAKEQGIRCALVQIIMGDQLQMYELIGFNTINQDMVYFEYKTKYQVNPIISERYSDCVVGKPYKIIPFNDTIVDILTIW